MTGAGVCSRMYCLTLGHERVPRWISVEGAGDEVFRCPVIAIAVHSPDGWFLLETGMSDGLRTHPERYREVYVWGDPDFDTDGDPLLSQLAACGLAPGHFAGVAVSHLHLDHSGGLSHFAGGPPIFIQELELAFALDEAGAEHAYWRPDYAGRDLRWQPLGGDGRIAAGIEAIFTPGHTPGHMSYLVTLPTGKWLFAIDAIDLAENLERDIPIGASARPQDAPRRRESHDRLVALAAAENARLVPGHCPVIWPSLRHPPEFYA